MRTLAAVLALALLAPSLARAQNKQEMQMLADMRQLQEHVAKLQLVANQLSQALAETNARLDEQAATNKKDFANQQLLVNNLSGTVNTVREKIDENSVRVAQLAQEFTAIRKGMAMVSEQLNTLVGLLTPPTNPVNPDVPADGTAPAGPSAPAGGLGQVRIPPSPTRLFDDAMGYYTNNSLDLAIEAWRQYLDQFPESVDAARAQYMVARAFYDQRKYSEALAEYSKVINNYKDSEYVPTAYYEQGLCYIELRQTANARKVFELVRKQFPESPEATLAAQKLAAPGTR